MELRTEFGFSEQEDSGYKYAILSLYFALYWGIRTDYKPLILVDKSELI